MEEPPPHILQGSVGESGSNIGLRPRDPYRHGTTASDKNSSNFSEYEYTSQNLYYKIRSGIYASIAVAHSHGSRAALSTCTSRPRPHAPTLPPLCPRKRVGLTFVIGRASPITACTESLLLSSPYRHGPTYSRAGRLVSRNATIRDRASSAIRSSSSVEISVRLARHVLCVVSTVAKMSVLRIARLPASSERMKEEEEEEEQVQQGMSRIAFVKDRLHVECCQPRLT